MSYEVHPGAGSAPLSVAAGGSSAEFGFTQLAAVDPVLGRNTMFVRVVQIDEGDQGGAGVPPDPSIRLAAGTGPLTDVGAAATPILAQAGGEPAANAALTAGAGGVYLVEVEVLADQPAPWRIQLHNNDSASRRYAWVVGTSKAATNRPWLDVQAGTLAFAAGVGATAAAQQVTIANYGPGPLTLDDADGADLGLGFRLLEVAPRPIAGNQRGLASIDFTAPGAAGAPASEHDFASNDPGAAATYGHNNRLTLTATVTAPELWGAGDILLITQRQGREDLWRFDRAGELTQVVTNVGGTAIAIDPNSGDAVVCGADSVSRFDRSSGVGRPLLTDGIRGRLTGPAMYPDGTVVVFDEAKRSVVGGVTIGDDDSVVWRFPPTGAPTFTRAPRVAHVWDAYDPITATTAGPGGDVVVVANLFWLIRIAAATGAMSRIPYQPDTGFNILRCVHTAPNGDICLFREWSYEASGMSWSSHTVERVNPQSGQSTQVVKDVGRPKDIAVAADGTVIAASDEELWSARPGADKVTLTQVQDVVGIAIVPSLGG